MENTNTDIQRTDREDIDYWLLIDTIDAERSGKSVFYHSGQEVSDKLGTNKAWVRRILYNVRSRLGTPCDIVEDDAE